MEEEKEEKLHLLVDDSFELSLGPALKELEESELGNEIVRDVRARRKEYIKKYTKKDAK